LNFRNISKPVNETNLNFYNYSGRWVHKSIPLLLHKQATLERSNFLFIFFISYLVKFMKKEKLVEFALEKINPQFSQFLCGKKKRA